MNFLKRGLVCILLCFFFVICCCSNVLATSASISVTESNGPVTVNASATFTSYEECDDEDPPNCTTNNSGTLKVYKDGSLLKSVSGEGTASWSTVLDGAAMANGDYNFRAVAVDSQSDSQSMEASLTIDNTPQLSAQLPEVLTGPLEIPGTAAFKECLGGNDGRISFYIDNSHLKSQYYDQPNVSFSYTDIAGAPLEVANRPNGDCVIKVVARAANGSTDRVEQSYVIDNPISVTAGGPDKPTGPVDITGTAQFIEYAAGNEGTIGVYYNSSATSGYDLIASKAYDSPTVNFSITDMLEDGKLLDVATWRNDTYKIQVKAKAANYNYITANFDMVIENPISVTASGPAKPTGPVDITGSAQFIEYLAGNEGTISIKYHSPEVTGYRTIASKTYDSPTVNFSITDMLEDGKLLDVATWHNHTYNMLVEAKAANYAWKNAKFDMVIENPISVTASGPAKPTGPVDITGTAQFIENLAGNEGTISIKYHSPAVTGYRTIASKSYDSPTVNYSVRDMLEGGKLLDVATWHSYTYNMLVEAKAVNDAWKTAKFDMVIKNPIDLVVNVPEIANGPLDVTGTAIFIDSLAETDGTITIGHDLIYDKTVSFDHPTVNFSYSQMAGTMLDTASWTNGSHNIFVHAKAPNYETLRVNKTITVDNTPELFLSGPKKVDHEFDISCNAVFKEHLAGNEGYIYMKLDDRTTSGAKVYTCVEPVVNVNYSDLAGAKLDARDLTPGEHTMYVRAKSYSSAWTPWKEFKFTVVPYDENDPEGSGNITDKIE